MQCWQINESNQYSSNIIIFLQKQLSKTNYSLYSLLDIKKEDFLGNCNKFIENIQLWYKKELNITFDETDIRIIYTSLYFLPLWYDTIAKTVFINQYNVDKTYIDIDINTKTIENDFKQFFHLILLYYKNINKYQDIKNQEELFYTYHRILDFICNHATNDIKWNHMAEDWNILRANAIVRDIYVSILLGYELKNYNLVLNQEFNIFDLNTVIYNLKWFQYLIPQEKEIFLSNYSKKLNLDKKLFFSEYFTSKFNLIATIEKLNQQYLSK